MAQLLSYYDASLSLLLRVSQTRFGATHVLDAGLFAAIRDCGIFGADPDIGLGMHFVLFPFTILIMLSQTLIIQKR